jgi:hypothetical protein
VRRIKAGCAHLHGKMQVHHSRTLGHDARQFEKMRSKPNQSLEIVHEECTESAET